MQQAMVWLRTNIKKVILNWFVKLMLLFSLSCHAVILALLKQKSKYSDG